MIGAKGFIGIVRLLVIIGSWGLSVASAQAAPNVTWTASSSGNDVATTLAPGYTTFTLKNDAKSDYNIVLFKLKDGADLKAFETANDKLNVAIIKTPNPSAQMNKVLEFAEVPFELDAASGASNIAGAVLEPGTYVIDGGPEMQVDKRTYHTMTVSGEPQAAAPVADVNVNLSEFAFGMPASLSAGAQTWEVHNVGKEVHHIVIFHLNDGVTMDAFTKWLRNSQGPPPATDGGYVGVESPGQTSYHMLDFTPGNYVAVCFMPDHAAGGDGAPHFAHGMIQEFKVASN